MTRLDNPLIYMQIQMLDQLGDEWIQPAVEQMLNTARRTEGGVGAFVDLFMAMTQVQRYRYFTPIAQYLTFQEKVNILSNLDNIISKIDFFDLSFYAPGTKIFLFDVDKSKFDNSFSNVNYDGFQIYGLSDYTKTWILDSTISNVKDRTLAIHKVVNLDLNILQFFNKFSQGKLNKEKQVFERFLSHFKENGFEYNMSTAMLERSKKPFEIKDKAIWDEIVNNYLKFIRADSNIENYTDTTLSAEEKNRALEMINGIGEFSNENLKQYDAIACLVCKAFLIKMDKTIQHKLDALLQYSLDILNVYLENEMVLLHAYFNQDESVSKTFKKIEGISKDTQNKILNTIWDIFHVRLVEWQMYSDNKQSEEIFLHYFSSHDKAFRELLLYNPLKMFIIHDDRQYAIRKKGIAEICKNSVLLGKINSEAKKRFQEVAFIDYNKELMNLLSEIKNLQDKQFKK